MAYIQDIKYFNAFLLTNNKTGEDTWHIEESKIKGDFNGTNIDYGAKAYVVDETYSKERRASSMIFSGVLNSKTGVNKTNQFSVAEDIVKDANIPDGPIQKLYSEETNLLIIQNDKVGTALINKDAIFSAKGGGTVTSSEKVIGEINTYLGQYGTQNPESFAAYGGTKYFIDKSRAAVLRLSQDGITEISNYGMRNYFRDRIPTIDYGYGMYDIHNHNYVVSLQYEDAVSSTGGRVTVYYTLAYDEAASGWVSRFTYKPQFGCYLNTKFYTFYDCNLWEHYSTYNYNDFHGSGVTESAIDVLVNENPSMIKMFKGVNYEGSESWNMQSMVTDTDTSMPLVSYDYTSTVDGVNNGLWYDSVDGVYYRVGFDKKENKFFGWIKNTTIIKEEEVSNGELISGIKGAYATIRLNTTANSQQNIYAVSTLYDKSSM
jgi:hypothetical protein